MNIVIFGKEVTLKIWVLVVLISVLVLIVGAIGFMVTNNKREDITIEKQVQEPETDRETSAAASNSTENGSTKGSGIEKAEDEIKVYVVGCVKNPGIYTLKKGQIINDAVKAAGGLTKEADADNINMVYVLDSNVMLKIKSKTENQAPDKSKENSKTTDNNEKGTSGFEITKDNGGVVVDIAQDGEKSTGKIDINKATVSQLDTLPGIGEATANDIIAYREKNGPFKAVTDLMKVQGIKESKFNKIKDYITIG